MTFKLLEASLMKFKKSLTICVLAASLSACVSTELAPAIDSVQETNDKILIRAENVICSPTMVGSATRRYDTPKTRNAYLTICNNLRDTIQGQ